MLQGPGKVRRKSPAWAQWGCEEEGGGKLSCWGGGGLKAAGKTWLDVAQGRDLG